MKLRGLRVEPLHFRLREDVESAHGPIRERSGYLVELHDECGARGQGEALPLPSAGTESAPHTAEAIRTFSGHCSQRPFGLSGLLDLLEHELPSAPAARCGVDLAAHDLEATLESRTVAELLTPAPRPVVATGALVGGGEPAEAAASARALVARGFQTLKLKVGSPSAARDLERVGAVREEVGRHVHLRVDANGAWARERAAAVLAELERFDLELVEQPVPAADLEGLAALGRDTRIPIAADEALASEAGRRAFVDGRLAGIGVLKPMVLGGLRPAQRLASRALRAGLRTYVTTTLDGPLATAGALALAAALPDSGLAHGLATAEAVCDPCPEFLIPVGGLLRVPGASGH